MPGYRFLFVLSLLFLSKVTNAQLSHQFKYAARNTDFGYVYGMAVGSDGTVFLAKHKIIAYSKRFSTHTGEAAYPEWGVSL